MKREIDSYQTLAGKIVNSKRPTVICKDPEMLEKIFGGYAAKIFTYHCKFECQNKNCKEKEFKTL